MGVASFRFSADPPPTVSAQRQQAKEKRQDNKSGRERFPLSLTSLVSHLRSLTRSLTQTDQEERCSLSRWRLACLSLSRSLTRSVTQNSSKQQSCAKPTPWPQPLPGPRLLVEDKPVIVVEPLQPLRRLLRRRHGIKREHGLEPLTDRDLGPRHVRLGWASPTILGSAW